MISLALLCIALIPVYANYRCAHPITPRASATNLSQAEYYQDYFSHGDIPPAIDEIQEAYQEYVQTGKLPPPDVEKVLEIVSSLGLHETSCYNFERLYETHDNAFQHTVTSRFQYVFLLELYAVEEVYPILETYNFSIPSVSSKCWCDCPGGRDFCSSGTHTCREPCISYFRPGQTTEGCSFTLGESQMCCQVELDPVSGGEEGLPQLRRSQSLLSAVKLGEPVVVATVRQKLYLQMNGGTSGVVFESERKVDLGRTQVLDDKFRVVLHHLSRLQPSLAPGWYFGPVPELSPGGGPPAVLYTGSDLNSLQEWDVRKLGWFKHDGESYWFDRAGLAAAVDGQVQHCGEQVLEFSLGALYTGTFPPDARDVREELGGEAASYSRTRESVTVARSHIPRLDVTMTLTDDLDIERGSHKSFFERYEAEVQVREGQDPHLRVTLFGASGSVEGKFYPSRGQNTTAELFYLYIPGTRKSVTRHVVLSSSCVELAGEVCFRPYREPEWACQTVYCSIQTADFVEEPAESNVFRPVELPKWTELLYPSEWFNGIDTALEGAIMCTCLVVFAGLVTCVLRLGKKLGFSIRPSNHGHSMDTNRGKNTFYS